MLSQTAEYALRVVLYVAAHDAEGPVKLDEVATDLRAPRNSLSKTMHLLARAGVLASARGPHGGFNLARPADRLTLAAVVAPFETVGRGRVCLLGRARCSDDSPCAAHTRWKGVSEQVSAFFHETTVADLLRGDAAARGAAVAAANGTAGARAR